jgi:hypothetical protein
VSSSTLNSLDVTAAHAKLRETARTKLRETARTKLRETVRANSLSAFLAVAEAKSKQIPTKRPTQILIQQL